MKTIGTLIAILALVAATAVYAEDSGLSVLSFGAKPDGVTDCTKAFQAALDAASATGDLVRVPAGKYRLDGTLTVPEGVTLGGVWAGPHSSQLDKGSALLAYAGRDKEDSTPFINLNASSTIKGVTIFYPEQKPKDIHPYPWTIQGRGQHFNVIDVTIVNAYNAVDCGTYRSLGHHLRNVLISAMRRGVFIDQASDIGRIENVHIHNVYWWGVSPPYGLAKDEEKAIEKYALENLEGFIIGRCDWEYMTNCFVIWAKIGFHFVETKDSEGKSRGLANILVTQSGADCGPVAVKVDRVQNHAGVAFENCQFMTGIEIGPENKGPVKFSNCGFWGVSGTGSQLISDGDCTVTMVGCHFSPWNTKKPMVIVNNGSLLMSSCDFGEVDNLEAHIILGKELKSASILGNRFRKEGIKVVNNSTGEVELVGNVKQ